MKSRDIKQLDEKIEEIANALISLGINRPVARTLAYLQHVNEAPSVELGRGAGLTPARSQHGYEAVKGTGLDN